MPQDPIDDSGFRDEGDDFHLRSTGTQKRVNEQVIGRRNGLCIGRKVDSMQQTRHQFDCDIYKKIRSWESRTGRIDAGFILEVKNMKLSVIGFLLLALGSQTAGDPTGFVHWSGTQLKGYDKVLAPKINELKVASQQLANFGNHSFMVAYREGDGQAELHETQADLFIVQNGEATLVAGGTVMEGKTTAPGEIRGASILGGERRKLAPGDVVHIPAKMAHQLLIERGKTFTYAVVKIDSK